VADRANALERIDAIARRGALSFAIDGALQPLGIPGHHTVGDECEGSGGGNELLGSATTFGRERLSADLPLQGVDRLATLEDLVDRAAKVRQRKRTVMAAWPLASPPRYSLTSKSGANRRLVEVGGPAGLSQRIGQAILCQGLFPRRPPILANSMGLVDAALAGSSFITAGGLSSPVCNVERRLRNLTEPS